MATPDEPERRLPPTRQDLIRWSETLAAIARTGLGFTESLYERERFEEVLHVAGDIRASVAADAELDVEHYVDEWMRSVGQGVAGYVTPKSAIGAVVHDDQGRILLVQRADSGVWLYPTGWADVGYSPAEVAVKEVREETGIECVPKGVIAVLDGMRMGMTRIPLYSTGLPLRGGRRRAERPPVGDERRRLVRRGRAAADDRRAPAVGEARVRGHPRRAAGGPVRPAPRHALPPLIRSPAMDETAIEIAEAVRAGERRAVDVLEECLAEVAAGNEALNAFVHVDEGLARQAAEAVDAAVARGEDPGPFAGVPFGVKDLDDCAGMPTTHGSLLYKGRGPVERDSIHVARLRAAGGVPDRQDGRPRVRHAQLHQDQGVGDHPQPLGPRAARPAGPPVAARRRWRPVWCPWRPRATAAAPPGSRPASRAWSA